MATFTPETKSILQVFIDGSPIYYIPRYQRPYTWVDDHVEKLFDDLVEAYENRQTEPEYFLGSIIVTPKDPNESSLQNVVDGQQRLTTLMILFNVILKSYPNVNAHRVDIDPTCIELNIIKNCIYLLNTSRLTTLNTHPQHRNDFRDNILNPLNFDNLRKPTKKSLASDFEVKTRFINTAYIFTKKLKEFYAKYNDENVFGDFINFLFKKVKLIKITCSDAQFAIKLFQVLNDRGQDLGPADLIKSYLLEAFSGPGQETNEETFFSEWQAIENLSNQVETSLTDLFLMFVYYDLASKPEKSGAEEIKAKIRREQANGGFDANQYISDFKNFISVYRDNIILTPHKDTHSFRYLPWPVYWKTILATIYYTNYPNPLSLIQELRRYFYVMWIAGYNLDNLRTFLYDVIRRIKAGEPDTSIKASINEKITDDDGEPIRRFSQNIKNDVYNQKWGKPLLLLIEYYQDDSPNFIRMDNELHVEHILPKKIENYSEREEDWNNNIAWSHIPLEDGINVVNTLGNLTLLRGKMNREAFDNSFNVKINIYQGNTAFFRQSSSFRITNKLVTDFNSGVRTWDLASIQARFNWLIGELNRILALEISTE